MDEGKKQPAEQEQGNQEANKTEEKQQALPEQEEKQHNQKQGRRFLTFYIIALFSIALVLIGISYMSQVKANRLNSQLTEQTTAAQGAKAKVEELQALVTDQEKTIEEYHEIFGVEKGQTAQEARDALDARQDALDALWKLEKNYQKEEWETCRQLISEMQTAYGEELQDREEGVLTDEAWDEYQAICQAVEEQ